MLPKSSLLNDIWQPTKEGIVRRVANIIGWAGVSRSSYKNINRGKQRDMLPKRKKWLPALVAVFVLAALVVSACGKTAEDPQPTDPGPSTGSGSETTPEPSGPKGPAVGGTLNLSLSAEPDNFNSIIYRNAYSADVIGHVYSSLFEANTNWELEGDLAEHWEFSDDNLTLTVKIREGVKFHNGDELTAEDVAWTLGTILHPEYNGPRATTLSSIESIEATDKYTVVFKMKEPFAPVLFNINFGIMNHRLFEGVPVAELADAEYSMKPVGSGPYKFVEYQRGEYVILERNPDWFRSAEHGGAPFIEEIHFRIIPDADSELAALEAGELDLLLAPPNEVRRLKEQYAGTLVPVDYERNGWGFIPLNNESGPTADPAVRQALTYATNRPEIIEAALDGLAIVPAGPIPPVSWAYDSSIEPYTYDPAKAEEILDAAGWVRGADGVREKDGERLRLEFYATAGTPLIEILATIAKENWEDIGAEVDLQFMEFNAMLENHVDPGNFNAAFFAFNLSLDPDSLYSLFHTEAMGLVDGVTTGSNSMRYSNPDTDRLLEEGRRETDPQKRKAIYSQVLQNIKDDAPVIFMYSNLYTQFYNGDKIKGGVVNFPGSGPSKVYLWWINEE